MLYKIAHIIRDRFGWLWRLLELINEWLFVCRYGGRLKENLQENRTKNALEFSTVFTPPSIPPFPGDRNAFSGDVLGDRRVAPRNPNENPDKNLDEILILPIDEIATEELVAFFERQPKEAFDHFKPHDFDVDTIKRLQRNRAFLGYVVVDVSEGSRKFQEVSEGEIVGYCFIRAYFHGKGFRGRMVDWNHRNSGIGTEMNRWMNLVGFSIGLRLFESISLKNPASCRTVEKSGGYEIIERLDESNLFVRIKRGDGF